MEETEPALRRRCVRGIDYETILERSIVKTLQESFGVEDLREADLSACAADYLRSLGLSDESIAALKLRLSGM